LKLKPCTQTRVAAIEAAVKIQNKRTFPVTKKNLKIDLIIHFKAYCGYKRLQKNACQEEQK
jgi:hypothetical protein